MPLSPRTLRPANTFTPRSIAGLALWFDSADSSTLYTTDAGAVTPVTVPTDITGCVLWLDGADSSAASMTLNGSLVETWKDKSNNGRDFTASGSARPTLTPSAINSRSAVTFAGSLTTMTGNAAAQDVIRNLAGYTVFTVLRTASVAGGERFAFGVGLTVLFRLGQQDSRPFIGGRRVNADSLESVTDGSGSLTVSTTFIQTAVVNHSSQSLTGIRNGAAFATDATYMAAGSSENVASAVSVGTQAGGTYGFWNGEIAEVIVFNTALSTADRARVEVYLSQRWGISGVHAPATATSDPVGAWLDKSGNARHAVQSSASIRPAISATAQGGKRALAFSTQATTVISPATVAQYVADATTSPKVFFAWVARPEGGAASVVFGSPTHPNNASRVFYASDFGSVGSHIVDFGSVDTARLTGVVGEEVNNVGHVYSAYRDGAVMSIRRDGVEIIRKTNATGVFSNTTGTLAINTTGGGAATSSWMEFMAVAGVPSASNIARIERYLAAKWGIQLLNAPQVSNADAQDWINRVYAWNGTVSSSTAAAVNQFCDDIDYGVGGVSIRDKFYRLNLFCGSNINAALVPLYRSAAFGGSPLGNAIDTNNAFTTTDYNETSGLGPQATSSTTKYLDTGFAGTSFGATRHVGVFIPAPGYTASNSHSYLGSSGASAVNHIGILLQDNGICAIDSAGGSYNATNATYLLTAGHYVGNTPSGAFTLRRTWRNGVAIGSGADVAATAASSTMYVFAENRNGTVARRTANGMYGYHFGLDMTSAQAEALRSAFNTFATAIGRPNI